MKFILKPLFELITGQFTLFGNLIYNYIAIAVVGAIAFTVAWNFVGMLYDFGFIESRAAGSLIHWTVRLIVFVAVFLLFDAVLWIIRLAALIPWWGWLIALAAVAGVIVVCVMLRKRRDGKYDRTNKTTD